VGEVTDATVPNHRRDHQQGEPDRSRYTEYRDHEPDEQPDPPGHFQYADERPQALVSTQIVAAPGLLVAHKL
jgi:hypothetical protein